MVLSLLSERAEADHMSADLQHLYDSSFKKLGFTPVEFMRLMSVSHKETLSPQSLLCQEGVPAKSFYYLCDGVVSVNQGGAAIASITSHQFIGEMSFLTFLSEGVVPPSSATCEVGTKEGAGTGEEAESTLYRWDIGTLAEFLKKDDNRGVRNALQAYISDDLRKKIRKMTTHKVHSKIVAATTQDDTSPKPA